MIKSKRPNTVDEYGDIGFIQAKVGDEYKNIDHIYDSDGNVIFQQGYLNEYQGVDDFGIPAIGKPLVDYTIYGNSFQDGYPTSENPIEPGFCGDLVSIELDEPLRAVGDYKDTLDLETKTYTKRIRELVLTGEEDVEIVGGNAKFKIPLPSQGAYKSSIISWNCSHYESVKNSATWINYDYLISVSSGDTSSGGTIINSLRIRDVDRINYTAEEYKSYLAQQYANNTPVKIWYVIAEPIVTTLSSIPDGLTGTIEGTVTQSGTPTPDNTIEPVFNGELLPNGKYQVYKTYKIPVVSRGVNLAPPLSEWVEGYVTVGGSIASGDQINKKERSSDYIRIYPGVKYYFSNGTADGIFPAGSEGRWYAIGVYDINKQFIYRYGLTFTAPENAAYCRLSFRSYGQTENTMFNEGSTPLPYVPYVAPTVKSIYLGQVPTTRKIKKLVLTGEEDWKQGIVAAALQYDLRTINLPPQREVYYVACTHYPSFTTLPSGNQRDGHMFLGTNAYASTYNSLCIGIANVSSDDIELWKSYLADQYAAGTPVVVWYVLATPEVGIVNEPLCRIGDYADSVDFSQAGIEIPTAKKPNTTVIDVETEVEPIEVDITYRGSTKPKYDLFLAKNGDSFEAKDGQSLYIGGNP